MKELDSLMRQWRQEIHAYPETAFEEKRTAALVAEKLRDMGYEVTEGIGGTGVVAILSNGDGPTIGLRADMDANPIQERREKAYQSQTPGKMHACGHDGHVATLLGAAKIISEKRNFQGRVCLIFQPAEEPGKGAHAMMADGLLTRFSIDEIYGLHNMPSLPAGTVHTKAGGIMASEDNFTIKIAGRGGHASSPHLGIDPLVTGAQIILGLQTIASRNACPVHPVVVSCTELHTDGAHNAIPSNVVITGDTRSASPEDQALIENRMRLLCEGICAANEADLEFSYTHEFYPTVNDRKCTDAVIAAAEAVIGKDNVNGDCESWMASEDFGGFLSEIPGCFFFLGSGKGDQDFPLHNANYDYNDDVLLVGAKIFAELVRQRLPIDLIKEHM